MDYFKLKQNNTNVKTEFNAGITTFLTMVYIVPLNAIIMSKAGMPMDALVTVTALVTIIATIFNGLWANTPIALSVGMGLNAYFTFGLCIGEKVPWQTALGIVFISSAIFLILSFTKFRIWVIKSIPGDLRLAISAGVGAFICFIGLKQMGFVVENPATLVSIGNFKDPNLLIGVLGLILVLGLWVLRVKCAFIIGIIITAIVAWIFGVNPYPKHFFSLPAPITPIFAHLDILGALKLSLLPVIVTFFVTHLFDSVGTLTGAGIRANIFDINSKESLKRLEKNLESDAAMSTLGSIFGTSTITAFLESASGVEAGGRTGLTAVFTGLCFVFTLFLLPFFKAIPANAIYPVLVIVGIFMFSEIKKINFSDFATLVASFFMIMIMPFTYSITNGLGVGFIAYTIIKLIQRKFSDLNIGIYVLTIISLLIFIVK